MYLLHKRPRTMSGTNTLAYLVAIFEIDTMCNLWIDIQEKLSIDA